MNKEILISIFCYNVGEFVFDVLEKIYSSNHHNTSVILINDFSNDNTISEIYRFIEKHKSKNLEVINNKKNMGYGYNYKLSFDFAIKNNYEKIIFIHGDGQYPPSQITKMSGFLNSNTLVFGSRFLKSSKVEGYAINKLILNKFKQYLAECLFNNIFLKKF